MLYASCSDTLVIYLMPSHSELNSEILENKGVQRKDFQVGWISINLAEKAIMQNRECSVDSDFSIVLV